MVTWGVQKKEREKTLPLETEEERLGVRRRPRAEEKVMRCELLWPWYFVLKSKLYLLLLSVGLMLCFCCFCSFFLLVAFVYFSLFFWPCFCCLGCCECYCWNIFVWLASQCWCLTVSFFFSLWFCRLFIVGLWWIFWGFLWVWKLVLWFMLYWFFGHGFGWIASGLA